MRVDVRINLAASWQLVVGMGSGELVVGSWLTTRTLSVGSMRGYEWIT